MLEEAEDAAMENIRKNIRDLLGTFLFSGDEVYKKVIIISGVSKIA
ncbi:MAG: hypothetical protein ABI045_02205 [Flavobacteriales bacterium]